MNNTTHLTDFGRKVMESGCPWMYEEIVGFCHMRVIVPNEFVDAVKALAYEYTPVGMRTDGVGQDAPQNAG
jgi:hypothetical protein